MTQNECDDREAMRPIAERLVRGPALSHLYSAYAARHEPTVEELLADTVLHHLNAAHEREQVLEARMNLAIVSRIEDLHADVSRKFDELADIVRKRADRLNDVGEMLDELEKRHEALATAVSEHLVGKDR